MIATLSKLLRKVKRLAFFSQTLILKIATFSLLGMCNWLSQWYKSSGQYSHQQIAAMFVNMVEKGLIVSSFS